jgi:hypothetical protein
LSRPLIKYRLYFDEAADRCVETVIEWDQDAGQAPEVVCATLPSLDDREHPGEGSVRRVVDAFFGAGVH